MGGTFNPIHEGHVRLALACKKQLELDRVFFVPDRSPVHKLADDLAPAADRLLMCELAVEGLHGIGVDDTEIKRAEKSYTVLTLESFHERFLEAALYFIMGTDMFITIEKWHRFEELFPLCTIAVGARDEDEEKLIKKTLKEYQKNYPIKAVVITADPLPASSTEIRQLLKNGESTEGILNEKVRRYIERRKLYGTK